jgi:copper transport protein
VTAGRTVRAGAAAALAAACAAACAPSASAHAGLVTSDPAAGAALGASPSAIRLTFSERPEPALSKVTVRSKRGVEYQSGPVEPAPGDPVSLLVPVRSLPRGVYTVDWRVDSSVDGHETTGAFAFGVSVPPSAISGVAPSSTTPVSSPLEVFARWVFLIGPLALIGAVSGALAGFGGPSARGLGLAGVAWSVATIGLLLLAEAQRRNAGSSFATLFASGVGHALIWRAIALAVAGAALFAGWRAPRLRGAAFVVTGCAGLAAIVVHVANGHAAEAGSWPSAITVGSQVVHLAVAGVWAGGLAALLLGLRGEPSDVKAAAIRRFSAIAAAGLAIVAVTGIVRAFSELRSWHDLVSTGYGIAVLAKLGLLAAIAALGWRVRRRAMPLVGTDLQPLRRLARAELVLAAAAVAVAALLGTLGPPVSVAYNGLVGLSAAGADSTHSVRVHLTTGSNAPGANSFTVSLDGYDSGAPLSGVAVSLRFTPLDDSGVKPTELSLSREADHAGTYTGIGSNLRFDGRWGVLVILKHGRGAVGVPLELDVPTPPQQASVQRIPGQAPVYSKLDGALGIISVSPHPERVGPSSVHIGVYTAALGDEAPVRGIVVTLAPPGSAARQQPVTRTGKGTFVAHMHLRSGQNQIAVIAHTSGGARLRSVFGLDVPTG